MVDMVWRVLPALSNLPYPPLQNDHRQEQLFWGIIFGGSTGKSCNSPGGYYITTSLENYFLSAVIAPFGPVKIFGEFFWSPSPPNLCGLVAGRGQGSGWWWGSRGVLLGLASGALGHGSWGEGGGPRGGGRAKRALPRERAQRERERQRESTGRGLKALQGRGGGVLTGQGLLQENIFGELFSGAITYKRVFFLIW